tara:strand:- start:414 stop:2396 length:1983 start_codon:yes stop_codon:yes gene_type:complete
MSKGTKKFTFIDLFAGIGGFHIAFHELGGECVFASEMDIHARKTYEHNFKNISPNLFHESLFQESLFNNDIRNIDPAQIPDFDVLCAGFPCQPFSQAGYKRGFDDNHSSERGNLFFNIAEIIDVKRPKAFFLENVRGLFKHDNGKTFKVIKDIIENDLKYSFYHKIVYASDYGLPQHRPRVFMIGFRDDEFMKGFSFPAPIPLKYDMDHVFNGKCNKKIGFTLRVGGRGSKIDDRRNWDSYYVDGKVIRLSSKEGKKMQGFPDNFHFPVSETQSMKQLGNSVAIDAIRTVGKQLLGYMNSFNDSKPIKDKIKRNKGEWSELLVLIKLIFEKEIYLSNQGLINTKRKFKVHKISTRNLDVKFEILEGNRIKIIGPNNKINIIDISKIINKGVINRLILSIKNSKGRTFELDSFVNIQNALSISDAKGGNSNQKSDILLDIEDKDINIKDEGFGIKSFLGSNPTILNASGNTNFIFKVVGFNESKIDFVNSINSRSKIRDRIFAIKEFGGEFLFERCEKKSMSNNLNLCDSNMEKYMSSILLLYYTGVAKKINQLVQNISNKEDILGLDVKIKRLLTDILLGSFAGTNWDGEYLSNGLIILKKSGDISAFHIIELENMRNYLFENTSLDTPSSTRHRFGKIYKEKNGELFFKLNLQLRLTSN